MREACSGWVQPAPGDAGPRADPVKQVSTEGIPSPEAITVAPTQKRPLSDPDSPLNRLAENVIGACIEVHRLLGPGFLESVYEEALSVELALRGIPFIREAPVDLMYKGRPIGKGRLDMLVNSELVLELKAVELLLNIHRLQVISYLKATGYKLALLINFNVTLLKEGIIRVINSKPAP